MVGKKFLPLHPLNERHALVRLDKEAFFEQIFIKQITVVQEAGAVVYSTCTRVIERTVNFVSFDYRI